LSPIIIISPINISDFYESGFVTDPFIPDTGISPFWVLTKVVRLSNNLTGKASVSQLAKEISTKDR